MQKLSKDLLERVKGGKQKAFDELYRSYREPALRFCNSILKDVEESENVIQDVFIKIWNRKETINPKSSKNDLLNYFSEVLPDYDQERVYASNIKKVLAWYNSLVAAKFDFEALKVEIEEEKAEEES